MQLDRIPFFDRLESSQNILLAGAGGGFDIYSGIPVWSSLRARGKNVVMANFSFTTLPDTSSKEVCLGCFDIKSSDTELIRRNYFPEKHLKKWLESKDCETPIYGFYGIGVQPLKEAYNYIADQHRIDTIILVDGGTDSLMFGDEEGLGTPHEDMTSMSAVHQCDIDQCLLLSIGFGIDHFHGVSHFRFLENVAEVARDGGYLGMFQVLKEMAEGRDYLAAVEYSNKMTPARPSIVSNSIANAVNGNYGDVHSTDRTFGSELWINPLMSIYWCFELEKLIEKVQYYDAIKDTQTLAEMNIALNKFRYELDEVRESRQIPI